jgi:hypothetical protein
MVQPIQYTVKAPSAFESLVSGLRLGTSLQQIQLQREQQMAAMQQAQQQAEAERQRQMSHQEFYRKARNNEPLTTADWLQYGETSGTKEYRELASRQIQNMSEAEQSARAGTMGQMISAFWTNPDIGLQIARDYKAANQNDRGFDPILKMAETRPKEAAIALYGMMSGLGGKFGDVAKNLADTLGMKAEKPAAEPEKIRILRAVGLEPTIENIGKLAAAERAPNADIAVMDVLGLPKTEAGYARLNELRQSGSGPLVTVQAGQPAPPSEFEKKVESVAADVYADWALRGGAANARARIAQLDDVVKSLERSAKGRGPTLTGVQIQLIPEFARPLLVPSSLEARQNAERVIQDGLRAILGAQFTQVEGENFLKRAFDPNLGPDVNARRLSLILEQMKESAKQAQALSDYVEKNRTARGFNGVIPSLAQFEGALARVPAPQRGQQGAADRPAERKPASQLSNEEILRRLGGQ